MKGFLGAILALVLCLIFIALLLILLFAMPVEFVVSSWHNIRVDASTGGRIVHSEVTRNRGSLEGSSITYTYSVADKLYESSRWRAGLLSNESRQESGGDFARNHPEGSDIEVYYDSSNPDFSMFQRGWPKWSLGFSLGVWGMLTSYYFKRKDRRTPRLLFAYPVTRALTITGFILIVFFPPTISYAAMKVVPLIFLVSALCAFVWLMLSKVDENEPDST